MNEEQIREMCDDIYTGGDWEPMIDYIINLQEKNEKLEKLNDANYLSFIDANKKRLKAIEYIKEHINDHLYNGDRLVSGYELSKILGGDEK